MKILLTEIRLIICMLCYSIIAKVAPHNTEGLIYLQSVNYGCNMLKKHYEINEKLNGGK